MFGVLHWHLVQAAVAGAAAVEWAVENEVVLLLTRVEVVAVVVVEGQLLGFVVAAVELAELVALAVVASFDVDS